MDDRPQSKAEKALRAGLALADGIVQNAGRDDLLILAKTTHERGMEVLKGINGVDGLPNERLFDVELDRRKEEIAARARQEATNLEKPAGIVADRIVMIGDQPHILRGETLIALKVVEEADPSLPPPSSVGIGTVKDGDPLPAPRIVSDDDGQVISIIDGEPVPPTTREGAAISQESAATAARETAATERAAKHREKLMGKPVAGDVPPREHPSDKIVERGKS